MIKLGSAPSKKWDCVLCFSYTCPKESGQWPIEDVFVAAS